MAEFRFTSEISKSSMDSLMLYLFPGMPPVERAGKCSPDHAHAMPMAQRCRVCPQPHLEQDLVWCDPVGICQKTEGVHVHSFHVQLGREVRAVPRSSQPSNVLLKLFREGMVLGRKAPL